MARAILKKEVDQVESELERAVKNEAKDKKDELDVSRRTKKEQLADVHRLLGDVATESGASLSLAVPPLTILETDPDASPCRAI